MQRCGRPAPTRIRTTPTCPSTRETESGRVLGTTRSFLDEHGQKIPGQWEGSPKPVEHEILTGSNADGTLAPGKTCSSWTSADVGVVAVVGHSDGLGPNMATTGTYTSWNSSHDNMDCSDTAPRGGAGRIYCFAAD